MSLQSFAVLNRQRRRALSIIGVEHAIPGVVCLAAGSHDRSGSLSLEGQRRAQSILAALKLPFPLRGEPLREGRALQVLELIGTPEAFAIIRALADGPATSPLALDAKRILERRKGS